MRSKVDKVVTNQLLDELPKSLQKNILAQCETVNLTFGEILYEQGQRSRYVFYPLTSFVSLVTSALDHRPLELCIIGNEGMLGVTCILGIDLAAEKAIVQGSGTALRLSIDKFDRQLKNSPLLLKILNNYLYILLTQNSKSLGCMRFHQIEPRLARWLLMTDDRAHANHFYLTHQFLADMLGVRRSGITVAAGTLQDKKLITYTRGNIHIIDRKGLELVACECYQLMKADYTCMLNYGG